MSLRFIGICTRVHEIVTIANAVRACAGGVSGVRYGRAAARLAAHHDSLHDIIIIASVTQSF
jgi:hypothetical protein